MISWRLLSICHVRSSIVLWSIVFCVGSIACLFLLLLISPIAARRDSFRTLSWCNAAHGAQTSIFTFVNWRRETDLVAQVALWWHVTHLSAADTDLGLSSLHTSQLKHCCTTTFTMYRSCFWFLTLVGYILFSFSVLLFVPGLIRQCYIRIIDCRVVFISCSIGVVEYLILLTTCLTRRFS